MEQEQLDAMSIDELEKQVDLEEGAVGAPEGGEVEPKATPVEPAKEEGPPKWFLDAEAKRDENLKRELGSLRQLASLGDKLPKMVQAEVDRRIAAAQQQQLSPEDQQSQAQLQTQQEILKNYVRGESRAEFLEAAKDYLPILQQLQEQNQDFSHRNSVLDLVKEVIPEGADKTWNELFEQSYKDIVAGKPGAVERQDRLEKDPAYVALAMIQMNRGKVQTQAADVTNQVKNSARQAAQTVKPGGVPATGKKNVADMSKDELGKLSIDELEAAIPEQN